MYKVTLALLALAHTALSAPIAQGQGNNPCPDRQGAGVCIKNAAQSEQTFYFYTNTANGNNWANPGDTPIAGKDTTVAAGSSTWVPLELDFKGRITRSTHWMTTRAEFQVQDTLTQEHTPDKKAHGNISLIQGYDGAIEIASLDGSGAHAGFSQDLMSGVKDESFKFTRPDGKVCLMNTEASMIEPQKFQGLPAVADYEAGIIGTSAHTHNYTPVPDVADANNQLLFTFY